MVADSFSKHPQPLLFASAWCLVMLKLRKGVGLAPAAGSSWSRQVGELQTGEPPKGTLLA